MVKEYGSNFEILVNNKNNKSIEIKNKSNILFLRSARECFFYIAEYAQKININTIFIPSLCCSSMVQAYLEKKFKIEYYEIKSNLKINIEDLKNKIKNNSILMLVNYYGIRGYDTNEIKKIIKEKENIILIQDCTQNIFTEELYDEEVDFQIGSLRKWVAIPDGAFLKSKKNIKLDMNNINSSDKYFIDKIYNAMVKKYKYLENEDSSLKEEYRKDFNECIQILKEKIKMCYMSEISKEIFKFNINLDDVNKKRKENYLYLLDKLKKNTPNIVRYSVYQKSPLCMVVILENRDIIQKELAQKGVYCQVLWPLLNEIREKYSFARWFSDHMLAIPCDQRYLEKDMDYIGNLIIELVKKYEKGKE